MPVPRKPRSAAATFAAGLAAISAFASLPAGAQQTAVFQLADKTNLTSGTYQIYVTGYSTAGPFVLQSDGSWATPALTSSTATLPCYQFPQQISQVQISSAQTQISARVYYFIVTDTATFGSCNPTGTNTGLFNVPSAFTYTYAAPTAAPSDPPVFALSTPPVGVVTSKQFPAWTFSEIGASSLNGTIDLSQVDFFAFPMNTTGTTAATTPPQLPNPTTIGNPVGATANPADVVNHSSIRDSYRKYIDALAEAVNDNKSCKQDATPAVCAYLDLLQDITTATNPAAVRQYVIQNPGGYLGQNTTTTQASGLNTVFDSAIATLWSTGAAALSLNSGGSIGGIPQDTFTSSVVTMNYPGTAFSVKAMKFTGTAASGSYVAYIFSPKDYETGCGNGNIPATYCSAPASTGYQVFAGAGALGPPLSNDTYTDLEGASLLSANAGTYGAAGYNALVARLGFLVSGALNRGVALVNCQDTTKVPPVAQDTWLCWQNETYWYPTQVSTTFPDITQNPFSRWMHEASIGGTPMFVQPPGAVNGAGSSPGAGKAMGMAYGFSNDENPTPQVSATTIQPEVPSKFDSNVVFTTPTTPPTYNGTITFGPWVTPPAVNPTLTVAIKYGGGGTVTSSPAGIDCGSACSHAYATGTQVVLTAQPDDQWIFLQWSGACAGYQSTCTVTLDGSKSAVAEFGQLNAVTSQALHVIVSGPGTVTSSPAGIDCGMTSCSKAFPANATVILTASPAAGAALKSWTGACAGSGATCAVTMSAAKTVGAAFVAGHQYALTVQGGSGGVVTTVPAGVDCGTRCVAGFAAGSMVGVIAQPKPGFRFSGWAGACSGTSTCDLTMDSDKTVSAAFTSVPLGQYALTVHDFGEGAIVSAPAGILCGTTCTAAFPSGTRVALTATPSPGHVFAGWSGACAGLGACVVYMDDLMDVYAAFVPSGAGGGGGTGNAIPTLSEWALVLLCGLMLLVAAADRRRAMRAKSQWSRGNDGTGDGRGERI